MSRRFFDKYHEKGLIPPIILFGATHSCRSFEVSVVGTKDDNSEAGEMATGDAFLALFLPGVGTLSARRGGAVTVDVETCQVRLREGHTNSGISVLKLCVGANNIEFKEWCLLKRILVLNI